MNEIDLALIKKYIDKKTSGIIYNDTNSSVFSGDYNDLINKPIIPDVSNLAEKATTLMGYGITDAKIQNGTIILGNNTITPLTSHQDISGYALKTELPPAIHNTAHGAAPNFDDGKMFWFGESAVNGNGSLCIMNRRSAGAAQSYRTILTDVEKQNLEKYQTVSESALDTADKADTIYVHTGSNGFIGLVMFAGYDNYTGAGAPKVTQYRFTRTRGLEYRTGVANGNHSYTWDKAWDATWTPYVSNEVGTISNNYMWYGQENGIDNQMTGTYTLLGNMCFLQAYAPTVSGWSDIYYSLPVAAVAGSATLAVENGSTYIVNTSLNNGYSVVHICKMGDSCSGDTVQFNLAYRWQ